MDDFKTLLKDSQLKITVARIAVLELLSEQRKPVSAETFISHLKSVGISADQATIYRILNVFEEKGIVRKVELEAGKSHFELASLPHHHHAVCRKCGSIQDIDCCDVSVLEKQVTRNNAFKVETHRLEIFGLCTQCQ